MFPLSFKKGSREMTIAVLCDKKSFEDLERKYTSDNQCADGAKKVDETVAFLSSKGITGTPAYIFENGRTHSGMIQEADALLKKVEAAAK